VHYAFIDIEVDYKKKLGFSSPENPYAPINAVTIYQSWTNQYLTYAVPPPGWDGVLPTEEQQKDLKFGFKLNLTICDNELDLIFKMLAAIDDADIISGWNSEFFDIPYIIKRIERVAPKLLSKMCFIGARPPKERLVERYGKPCVVYTLSGRTHLDYLDLFKKFTFEGRTSYSLGNIASEELDIPKLHYEGTLEQLYNRDFAWFCLYNARDVEVLVKLDHKFKFIQTVNQMAHENCVLFENLMGTVKYVETGISLRAHHTHNLIVPDKSPNGEKNEKVEGAIVMTPVPGLHEWCGSVDLTSLYPSVIRALNMSIETFFGQFINEEDDWFGVKNADNKLHTLQMADGSFVEATGADWLKYFKDKKLACSAFGTVFTQDSPGMVADALTFWFTERKRLQAEKKKYSKEADTLKKTLGVELSAQDAEISELIKTGEIVVDGSKIYTRDEWEQIKVAEQKAEHYDLLQLTKKIQLNSTYGALLNEAFTFGRREIGASVTATGRQITKHMVETIAYILTGIKHIVEKRYAGTVVTESGKKIKTASAVELAEEQQDGLITKFLELPSRVSKNVNVQEFDTDDSDEDSADMQEGTAMAIYRCLPVDYLDRHKNGDKIFTPIIYGDTDSCYFKTGADNKTDAVLIADETAAITNESFPEFLRSAFFCVEGRDDLMKAAREIVGIRGVWLPAKKKYTIRVVDEEGKAVDKLKTMGSEMKKADTPKPVQDFLKEMMGLILDGKEYEYVEDFVLKQRKTLVLQNENVLSLGVAKQVNNLDALWAEYSRTEKIGKGKTRLPGHVRASINYNEIALMYEEGPKLLSSGDKGLIFYLKPNMHKIKSIAFPADLERFPDWFNEHFEIDRKLTEEKMIDSKITSTLKALKWEVPTPQNKIVNSILSF